MKPPLEYKKCEYRHPNNGNCMIVGGFCGAHDDNTCVKHMQQVNTALREQLAAENMVLAKLGAVQGRYYPFVGEADYNNGYNAAIRVVDGIINEWRDGQEGAG